MNEEIKIIDNPLKIKKFMRDAIRTCMRKKYKVHLKTKKYDITGVIVKYNSVTSLEKTTKIDLMFENSKQVISVIFPFKQEKLILKTNSMNYIKDNSAFTVWKVSKFGVIETLQFEFERI